LILAALKDRSPLVRRAAADALIETRAVFSEIDSVVEVILLDPSPALRDRAEFLRRKLIEERATGT
jgi:hypothetical protein